MKPETKNKLAAKLKELFTFLYWSEPTQGQLMMKELNDTAVMVRFLIPYMGWNTEIRTTLHGNMDELIADASDVVPFMSETKVFISTANTYNGKPISAEYTLNNVDGAGMSKILDQTFKQFEDKVRRDIYDMKKAGNFVDDSIEDKDAWEAV